MTDVETYSYWAKQYDHLNERALVGAIDGDDCDRLVRNMEERLGVNTWSQERWRAAHDAWLTQTTERY